MSSLSPLEQLTVDAFAIALETCREENVELPEDILALEADLEAHVEELSAIAQRHPQLQASYRMARNVLRRQSGDRSKRLFPTAKEPETLKEDLIQLPLWKLGHRNEVEVLAIAQPPEALTSDSSNPNPGNLYSNFPDKNLSPQPPPTPPKVRRFVLPANPSQADRDYFQTYIADLKRLNPQWLVSRDRCNPGESEAYVMMLNNEDYQVAYAAYIGSQMINDFLADLKR